MRAYVFTVVVVDHEGVERSGPGSIAQHLEAARYISPTVTSSESFDIGEWEDDHPLNYRGTDAIAWLREHGKPCAPDAEQKEYEARIARDRAEQKEKEARKRAALAELTPQQREDLGL